MRVSKMMLWLSAGAVSSAVYLILRPGVADASNTVALANALTLPGVLMSSVGALVKIWQSGVYETAVSGIGTAIGKRVCGGRKNTADSLKSGVCDNTKSEDNRHGTELLKAGTVYLAAALVVCCFA